MSDLLQNLNWALDKIPSGTVLDIQIRTQIAAARDRIIDLEDRLDGCEEELRGTRAISEQRRDELKAAYDVCADLRSRLDAETKRADTGRQLANEMKADRDACARQYNKAIELLQAMVVAMQHGATTDEMLATIRDGVGIVEAQK